MNVITTSGVSKGTKASRLLVMLRWPTGCNSQITVLPQDTGLVIIIILMHWWRWNPPCANSTREMCSGSNTVQVTDGSMCHWLGSKVHHLTMDHYLQAACLYLAIIIALQIFHFLDDLIVLVDINWCIRFVHDRYMVWGASKVNGEWRTVKILAVSHVVDEVKNHSRC